MMMSAALALAPGFAAAQLPQKSVMFVYSGERTVAGHSATRNLSSTAVIDLTLEREVRQALAGNLYHYSEHLDSLRMDDPAYERDVLNLLRSKYEGRPFDLIFVFGDVAVNFVSKHRGSFFPEVPIVFSTADPVPVMPNATGITTPIRQIRVLETALRVQPDTTHVAIVAGSSDYDQYYVRSARAEFKPYEGRLTFTYLTGLPIRELLARVRTLPQHSIILFMGLTEDGEGRLFLPQEMLESVSAAANAPTYGWHALGMGYGIVGGTMNTPEVTARRMAALGLRVMQGERAADIPVTEIDSTTTQFDWRQLRRWNISEARLPPNSTILFRVLGPWELYKSYIIGGMLIMAVQTALIAGLVVQRARRRRTERALRESYDQNQDLAGRLINAQEDERARIARDLHDDLSQRLAGVGIMLSGLKRKIARPGADPEIEDAFGTLQERMSAAATAVRPEDSSTPGCSSRDRSLTAALQSQCADVERHHQIAVTFSASHGLDSLDANVSLCLFRVAQEALSNAVRHARARTIAVNVIRAANHVELEIADDGVGFVAAERSKGLGLRSIRERVRLVGGSVSVDSHPGKGTTVRVRVPAPSG